MSSHACLAYGTFVCTQCANIHTIAFGGRSRSQIKDVFGEQWDDYQLEAVAPGIGGNKMFYTFLQEYEGLALQTLEKKYKSDQVSWYMKKLAAHLDQRLFVERQPAKTWDERFERAKSSVKKLINKSDKKPVVVAEPITPKSEETTIAQGIVEE